MPKPMVLPPSTPSGSSPRSSRTRCSFCALVTVATGPSLGTNTPFSLFAAMLVRCRRKIVGPKPLRSMFTVSVDFSSVVCRFIVLLALALAICSWISSRCCSAVGRPL